MKTSTLLLVAVLLVASAIPARAGSTAAQVSFTHGVLAFEKGDAEEAARLFAEAVVNDPDDGTFLHWLGLAELRRGRAAEAVARLEESLQARKPPAAGRRRVREDLRLARTVLAGGTGATVEVTAPEFRPEVLRFEEMPRWEGSIGFAAGWDSNPELVTEDRPFTLPGEIVPGGVPSDTLAALDADVRFRPSSPLQGWSLGFELAGHQAKHQDEDDLDLALVDGAASLGWGGDPRGILEGPLGVLRVPEGTGRLALLLQAGGSRAWLGGDLYRDSVDSAVSLFVRETPATTTRLAVTWSDRDFADDDLPLLRPSGQELAGRVDQWIFLGHPGRSLRLGAEAGRYDANRIFERTFREVGAEAVVPLAARWTLFLAGERRRDDYAHPESNVAPAERSAAPARQDSTWRAAATVAWRATDRFSWSLRASHARRTSNVETLVPAVPLLDYERTAVSLGVQWLF